jgi:hypothetical protein
MTKLGFKQFFEATDIFGLGPKNIEEFEPKVDPFFSKPINQFNIELMINLLSKKSLGSYEPNTPFLHEITWGNQPGSIKLEIDTGYTFFIKQLGIDRQGNPRWLTKKMFQLNRQGYGGTEDIVAQEIYEQLNKFISSNIESPKNDYDDLPNLVDHVYKKIMKTCKPIFIPEGVRKLSEDAYILKFGVRGHGLEAKGHQRIEQNQTLISYDRDAGTIRITNYNIESPVGRRHSWKIKPNDLDLYFFPTQDRDEISEAVAVHMKYY